MFVTVCNFELRFKLLLPPFDLSVSRRLVVSHQHQVLLVPFQLVRGPDSLAVGVPTVSRVGNALGNLEVAAWAHRVVV